MLSIGKIALGQHRYYEEQVAGGRDDYYAGRGEAPGEWVGRGAEILGLHGRVSAEQFGALIAGRDPGQPGERLRSSGRDPRVAALDLTFSAPKSVSVLAAVAEDQLARELILAHEQALRAALGYLEESAVRVRRGHDGRVVEAGEGLIAAAYRHRMSRALDPQLHTHVVAVNMARGQDGRYTALHGAPLYRAAKTAGYLYQAHLRALVSERLGLSWKPVRKGAAELDGVPRLVLEEFSKRRQEMLRAAERGGIGVGTKAAAQKTALATRDRKRYGIDTHSWREEVRARAGELGLGTLEVEHLDRAGREAIRRTRSQPPVDERALGGELAGPHGLTERANSFDERDVLQRFAAAAQGGETVEEVRARAARFIGREDVLPTGVDRGFTTTELVECERGLIAAALTRVREGAGVIDGAAVEGALGQNEWPLSCEQETVVRAVAGSGRGVEVIEALAGTGKTHAAAVLGGLYERAGFDVVGVAPTGRAARELSERGVPAHTLDRLLIDLEQVGDELHERCVVIFDEAGMAPTRASAKLLQAARNAGAKVITIGDPGQLASVQAGGWLAYLGRRLGSLRLTEVMRQRDRGERRALAALHDCRPERYLAWAQAHDRIGTFTEQGPALEQAIGDWIDATQEVGLEQAVMIARENDTRERLNDAARELLRALGLLGQERSYGPVPLAVGDRVICRRNDSPLDLDNGTRGTVRHIEQARVVIETDSRLIRELPAAYVAEHVQHAYALTGHGMQGATVERAIVLASPRELTAGWSYTALSRARGTTRLLIHGEQSRQERSELAPREKPASSEREKLLTHAQRCMLQRDCEELAVEQLSPAGRADDRALTHAQQMSRELPQERAAARAEAATRPVRRESLATVRGELERLRAQRRAPPIRKLARLEDVEVRIAELADRRDRAAQALHDLPDAPRQRPGHPREGQETEAGRLAAALRAYEDAIGSATEEHARLRRELGDPEQARSERDGLDRAIHTLEAHTAELRARERERGQPVMQRHERDTQPSLDIDAGD